MNLGAGRIVYQDLAKINLAVANHKLRKEKALVDAFQYAKDHNKPVHFLGLLSDGGVHSHTSHLRGLIDATQDFGLEKVFVHAFTDGRDVDPKSGALYLEDLYNYTQNTSVKLASVIGRVKYFFWGDGGNRTLADRFTVCRAATTLPTP